MRFVDDGLCPLLLAACLLSALQLVAGVASASDTLTMMATSSSNNNPIDDGLTSDAECTDTEEGQGKCGFSALQLRGELKVGKEEGHGSCASYGCTHHYHSWQHCQCNANCESYGNCCHDFTSKCVAGAHGGVSPAPAPSPPPVVGPAHHTGKIFGHPDHSKSYPSYPGFSLMLVEEFNSPLDLDSDPIWTWSDGGLIEGQIRFTKNNIKFGDGKMKVHVSRSPAHEQSCSNAEVAMIPPKALSSGEMRSRYNMFRYGRYEVRMKAPSVQPGNTHVNGNYVSTFFVFRDAKYKHWREIDFEITGDSPASVTTNVLSADNTDKWKNGIQESEQHKVQFNTRSEFHTYAFEWLPNKITWYIDGVKVREKHTGGVRIPDLAGKIMMNLWMFDDRALFGGPEIKNNQYPMESEYDWIRFYKWDGDSHYPCSSMDSSCLTSDDKYLSSNNPCDGIPQVGTVYGKTPCHASCHR